MSENLSKIKIRPARTKDLPAITEIERLSFPTPWPPSLLLAELNKDYAYFWIALADEKVIGYICFWIIKDEAHLVNIAVHPHSRRKGIGSKLLEDFLFFARRRGVKKVYLEVRARNKRAQKFYEKFGFKKDGLRKAYYQDTKDDAILMSKRL
ncbi:ribosomal-protein-alanine acetyltransferase [Thermodesulfatator indicus DSM 15286]|uniref:[Ribosomal protein bS18]-alanine N-acetyltransferase n=1 Tax=Thermodesulfatator indicus (strain DSM 15286 / JCM 11887 / CIR29812) TaxID=667014 RepID=F8A9P1_THEID|nr:ribosomal protein S18-alanine N-acetyltransferase [Thermodesulfatator indicus]AEH45273.1 ribosomal-protein-alanine acetyltransferase [Thermodesulfatator indicus DSM 15286]